VRKLVIGLVFVLSVFIFPRVIDACTTIYAQYFRVQSGNQNCAFGVYSDPTDPTINYSYPNDWKINCELLHLSSDDKATVLEQVEFYSLKNEIELKSTVVLAKQSNAEYEDFVLNKEKINKNVCDCNEIEIIKREGEWTYYRETNPCETEPSCENTYPKGCFVERSKSFIQNIVETFTIFVKLLIF